VILPKPRLQIYDDDAARNALCSDTMFYVTIFFYSPCENPVF